MLSSSTENYIKAVLLNCPLTNNQEPTYFTLEQAKQLKSTIEATEACVNVIFPILKEQKSFKLKAQDFVIFQMMSTYTVISCIDIELKHRGIRLKPSSLELNHALGYTEGTAFKLKVKKY